MTKGQAVCFTRTGDTPILDRRLHEIRPKAAKYCFPHFLSLEDWLKRKEEIKNHILVSAGLVPSPPRPSVQAVVTDTVAREEYIVEKVYFNSVEGLYVTGNLYRPAQGIGPFPAILNPHGHWEHGRFENSEAASVPARCIHFARMGYVAFSYDMLGYGDSLQISHTHLAEDHRAAMWGVSTLGLQLWNSIRAVDFLSGLPYVDPDRIGCTGASGGGTQTFLLSAVDDRIQACAPVNMISSAMEGGCGCENAGGLRLNTSNVEIAATMAPRPMLIVCCTADWTRNFPVADFPNIQHIYTLFSKQDHATCKLLEAPVHNYNKAAREVVYDWFRQWLPSKNVRDAHIPEMEFVGTEEELRLFPSKTMPADWAVGDAVTDRLLDSAKRQAGILPEQYIASMGKEPETQRAFFEAFKHVLAPGETPAGDLCRQRHSTVPFGKYTVSRVILGSQEYGEHIPCISIGYEESSQRHIEIIIHSMGKIGLFVQNASDLLPYPARSLQAGKEIFSADVFLTGEYHSPFAFAGRVPESWNFFTTYNRTDLMWRVRDIILLAAYIKREFKPSVIDLTGLGDAGAWCMLAAPFIEGISTLTADFNRRDHGEDTTALNHYFAPSLLRMGGLQMAACLQDIQAFRALNPVQGSDFIGELLKLYQMRGIPAEIIE